jgi:hypothetical protein
MDELDTAFACSEEEQRASYEREKGEEQRCYRERGLGLE